MKYKLSICIPTLNRGNCIGETLESIVSQWRDGVEVVIVDGGSTDDTEHVVNSYQKRFPDILFVKKGSSEMKASNEGFDRDCDRSVALAGGEYCWLMTDDDLLKPGALTTILSEVEKDYDLVVANAEVMNNDFTESLLDQHASILQDRMFEPSEWDDLACVASGLLTFVGSVIIKRQLWLSRNRENYYGSGFIHVGVIFEEPFGGTVLVKAEPLVSIRYGNAQWSSRAFQIWMINWPDLIWSFPSLSDAAKSSIIRREPWRELRILLFYRALGMYSSREYQLFIYGKPGAGIRRLLSKLIATVPRALLYIPLWTYLIANLPNTRLKLFDLKASWKGK
ncbi:MAG: glycosyltransferase family 2 protein [Dechloromonas sp.]|uniref:Glycosyltransferase family 2 protein n=1 Tax=Candidatus Dechloromonas phosphorivorans TaxID=2899244 RepID=A0A9D7LPF7_9RHOO|nr:glycosyltransferase family 2 protein [Candidatus Dechloromonas phosphorivorans]